MPSLVVSSISCPTCRSPEEHPTLTCGSPTGRQFPVLLIRSFKVCDEAGYWWSQCLVCAGYYDRLLKVVPKDGRLTNEMRGKGWF